MIKITNKKWFCGIDISKDTIDVNVIEQASPDVKRDNGFANNFKGFDKMLFWFSKNNIDLKDCLFCMEHTGTYGLLLFSWLSQREVDYCVEPALQIKRSLGMTRGKNDRIDAHRIAKYAMLHHQDLKPYILPAQNLLQIKQLLTYRDQLVGIRASFKNSIKSHREYQQLSDLKSIAKDIKKQIDQYSKKIDELENQILEIINSDEKLKKNYGYATSVKGIGLIITAFMLVTTSNFSSFENGRKYACYAGIAPFENTSGISLKGKTKTSHLANKKIKTLLSNGANSAYKWDPEIKAYYERKRSEGKEHKSVINAICCKLVYRVFAVVKRQSNYVSTYQQNFLQ
jgi:transposase